MTTLAEPMVAAHNVSKHFPLPQSPWGRLARQPATFTRAVHRVSLAIWRGETLGLVGESGCGKSTLGRLLLRLHEPTDGTVHFDEADITHLRDHELRPLRRRMQIIFQDPYSSLNPRHTVRQIIDLPLRLHFNLSRRERRDRIAELLQHVGLQPDHAGRYPHQFSGGQRQRVGIARALAVEPAFIVADEPVAALDVSVQAQILNLLGSLNEELHLTSLFISHDLGVVSHLSDRIAVMYLGKLVEIGPTHELIDQPLHPYTKCLLAAVPEVALDAPAPVALGGEVPSASAPPPGCPFHPRCPLSLADECREVEPQLSEIADGREVACHLAERQRQ